MISIRQSEQRGAFDHGWLKTKHTFSFGNYFDRNQMHFRSLRVINEDFVAPESGFPRHPHQNMEILTYIVSGELTHTDSLGHREVIKRGDVQYTNAGSGIEHSEFNEHPAQTVHLLQIWIMPKDKDLAPAYSYKHIGDAAKQNKLCLLASPNVEDNVVWLNQDARIYASILEPGNKLEHKVEKDRGVWLQLISGSLQVNDTALEAGDAAKIEDVDQLTISANETAEFLLFDLA